MRILGRTFRATMVLGATVAIALSGAPAVVAADEASTAPAAATPTAVESEAVETGTAPSPAGVAPGTCEDPYRWTDGPTVTVAPEERFATWTSGSAGRTQLPGGWHEIARAPFGSAQVEALWADDRLIVVEADTRRTVSYDPVTDAWTELEAVPEKLDVDEFGPAVWTGTEVFIPRLVSASTDLGYLTGYRYDPGRDTWSRAAAVEMLPDARVEPIDRSANDAVWNGERILVVTSDRRVAAYDPAADCWDVLPPTAGDAWGWYVYVSDSIPLIETRGADGIAIHAFDPATDTWTKSTQSPLDRWAAREGGFWFGDRLAYVTFTPGGLDGASDAWYDPTLDEWTVFDHSCGGTSGSTIGSIQVGGFVVDGDARRMLDMETGSCLRLPDRPMRLFGGTLVSTGDQLIYWSGAPDESSSAKPRGFSYALE